MPSYDDVGIIITYRLIALIYNDAAAFYASSSIIESVRKSLAENATALLSRALQMCKDKMVVKYIKKVMKLIITLLVLRVNGFQGQMKRH